MPPPTGAETMRVQSEAEILEGLRRWVEIETPTGCPEQVDRLMALAAADYAAIGGTVERVRGRFGAGSHLSVRLPWTGRGRERSCILVLCHLDTVHPLGALETRLPFRVEGDRAYGPGICDMKGGAYIALCALRTLREAGRGTPLPVRVLLTSDEETGSATSRELIERAAADAAYVLVPEYAREGGRVVTGRRGVARYAISTHGRAAHAGDAHAEGRSAIASSPSRDGRIPRAGSPSMSAGSWEARPTARCPRAATRAWTCA
jgi:glutamate carboxypeptidase